MAHNLRPEQRAALDQLVERGVLDDAQHSAVLGALRQSEQDRPHHGGVWEVVAYLGGALVLGAAGLLAWTSWDLFGQSTQVTLLAVASLVLLVGGTVLGGRPRDLRALSSTPTPKARIVAVLYTLGSVSAAMTVQQALDTATGISAIAAGFVVALLGYTLMPSTLGLFATGAFSVGLVLAISDQWFDSATLVSTLGLLALGVLWCSLASREVLINNTLGTAGGAAIALAGSQLPVANTDQPWWGYGLTVLIAVLCFVGYARYRDVALVVLGILGITTAVPEAIWDWTDGSLSGPLIVLVCGLVFLITAGIGLRIRRRPTGA